jgi:multisubunit Na+/H+ antiporter MnhG subunit
LVLLVFATTPTASHLLARAAVRESGGDVGGASVPDADGRGPDAP